MAAFIDPNVLIKVSSEIVIAFLNQGTVSAMELPALVARVRLALEGEARPLWISEAPEVGPETSAAFSFGAVAASTEPEPAPPQRPAVPIEESIQDEYLVSLEDGKHYRSLRRHLMSKYRMTPDEYRRKWDLPKDYPMVAPSYARERSDVAKRIGLGRMQQRDQRSA